MEYLVLVRYVCREVTIKEVLPSEGTILPRSGREKIQVISKPKYICEDAEQKDGFVSSFSWENSVGCNMVM